MLQMKSLSALSLLGLTLLLGAGCRVKVGELPGTYKVRYQHGSETLLLRNDGTFRQVYIPLNDGASMTNSGTWQFDKSDRAIVLRDVIQFDQWGQQGNSAERIVWRIRIARFGKLSLIIDEDVGLEYEKTNPESNP
jgi:hypothetical protein